MYRRVVTPYSLARWFRIAILILAGTAFVAIVRLGIGGGHCLPSFFPFQRSIYDDTAGKTTSGPWRHTLTPKPPLHGDNVSPEAAYLLSLAEKHGITGEVLWFSRQVQARHASSPSSSSSSSRQPQPQPQPSITEVKSAFMKPHDFVRERLDGLGRLETVEKPLVLEMGQQQQQQQKTKESPPGPGDVDGSPLLFGVSTTYARLVQADHAIPRDWAQWLTDGRGRSNGARLVLVLHGANDLQVQKIRDALRRLGVNANVSASRDGSDAGERYAQLVQQMMKQKIMDSSQDATRRDYLALVDDDVFFPSMNHLLKSLQQFDPSEVYYIGVPGDRSDWVVVEEEGDSGRTAMTYGGSAVFLTAPMWDVIGQWMCLQYTRTAGQTDDDQGKPWDVLLYKCITRNSDSDTVKLYVLPGPYDPQNDGYGDGGGGGIQQFALALHQYRNYHHLEAGPGHAVASVCGEDCFLQRFAFEDDWILVNGYTLTHYRDGVTFVPRRKKQKTKIAVAERLVYYSDEDKKDAADRREIVAKGRKKTWRLLDATVHDNGKVWQAYINRKEVDNAVGGGDRVHGDEEKSDVDSVIVLVWEPDR